MRDIWRKLQREFKDWPLGELKDAASSVSPSMSPEARKVQVRYQELVKEYTKEEFVQGSGHGRRLTEAKSRITKQDITSKKGATVAKGAEVTLSWKSSSGAEQPQLTRITDSSGNTVAVRTANLDKYVSGISKAPSIKVLEKWSDDGVAKSVLGAKVEPDGWDADESPSWMLAMGLI